MTIDEKDAVDMLNTLHEDAQRYPTEFLRADAQRIRNINAHYDKYGKLAAAQINKIQKLYEQYFPGPSYSADSADSAKHDYPEYEQDDQARKERGSK